MLLQHAGKKTKIVVPSHAAWYGNIFKWKENGEEIGGLCAEKLCHAGKEFEEFVGSR